MSILIAQDICLALGVSSAAFQAAGDGESNPARVVRIFVAQAVEIETAVWILALGQPFQRRLHVRALQVESNPGQAVERGDRIRPPEGEGNALPEFFALPVRVAVTLAKALQ